MAPSNHSSNDLTFFGQSVLLDALSRAFSYPGQDFYDELVDGRLLSVLSEGLDQVSAGPDLFQKLRDVAAGIEKAGENRSRAELETDYIALFEVNRNQPPLHLYGGLYGEGGSGRLETLQRLTVLYRVHGLEMEQGAEQADHLTVEMEFLAFLYGRLAKLLQVGAEARKGDILQGIRALTGELGWTRSLVGELKKRGGHPFYLPLGRLLTAVLALPVDGRQ